MITILKFCNILRNTTIISTFPHDDYQHFLELIAIFLKEILLTENKFNKTTKPPSLSNVTV